MRRLGVSVTASATTVPMASASAMAEVASPEPSGPACIDVGGGRGALVLRSTPERAGLEVEIHLVDEPENRIHVYVLPRSASFGVLHAALFPSLRVGNYQVLDPEGRPRGFVEIAPGRVTTSDWR